MKSFASDNYAGVLPEVMRALELANVDHQKSYGADDITKSVKSLFQTKFGNDVDVHFVFNGTAANVLSLSGCVESYQAVLCARTSHIYNDESTAPESFLGSRIIPIDTTVEGKITPQLILAQLSRQGDQHAAQVKAVSITQSTEYGTLYSLEEIRSIANICQKHGLYLHMDGARLFQAAASLNCTLKELTTDVGIDVLSLGGTKLGMMFGEAVVVINLTLQEKFFYRHKQMMQLSSKTRFISAQFEAILSNDLWRSKATHANSLTKYLAEKLSTIKNVSITRPVQANAIFAIMPRDVYLQMNKEFPFYMWDESRSEVRLMCSFDTNHNDVDHFIHLLQSLL